VHLGPFEDARALVTLHVGYHVVPSGVPFAGRLARYRLVLSGARQLDPVPLDPQSTRASVPVRAVPGSSVIVRPEVAGLVDGGRLVVDDVHAEELVLGPEYDAFLDDWAPPP
jgi:hypothetical protein